MSVGWHLRELRRRQGRTLEDVATRSGCSRSMLSKVENDHAVPSLTTLMALARTLGVEPSALMCGDASGGTVYERAGQTAEVPAAGGQRIAMLATSRPNRRLQPCLHRGSRSDARPQPRSHDGELFIYVLEGELQVRVGLAEYRLQTGDSLYFDARHEHDLTPRSRRTRWLSVHAGERP